MHILFGMGEKPELKYLVKDFDVSLSSQRTDESPANCVPGEIAITLDLPPTPNPASEILSFAKQQHETAATEGSGKIVVYPGEGVGESIQEVSFKRGWITSFGSVTATDDDRFGVTVRIAAEEVSVSGIVFRHSARSAHFQEAASV